MEKISKKVMLAGSVIAMTLMTNAAMANSGKIDFEGGVSASTCDVSVNKQGQNAKIKLPKVSSKLLDAKGKTAGRTSVNFELSNCTLATGDTKASVYFVADSNVNTDGRLENTETTSGTVNVDLQMLNEAKEVMDLSLGVDGQKATKVTVDKDKGTATIRHYAEYYATGVATAGGLTANVEYEINYE